MNTTHRARRALTAASVIAAAALTGLGATAPAAESASPHRVDPATLQPPLNPNFAPWSCWEAGTGTTCQGSMHSEYHELTGLECGGQEVWVQGYGDERMTRWHTADGLATKTQVTLSYPADVYSLSSTGDGPSVTLRGHWQRHYTYPVPGDRDSRVMREIGAIFLVNVRGQGMVLQDTGVVTFAPGGEFEAIDTMHGIHEAWADDAAFDEMLCDQLG